MTGAATAFFVPMALAVGFSMVASYLLSSVLVSVLSVWVLKTHASSAKAEKKTTAFERLQARYGQLVEGIAGWCWVLVPVYVGGAAVLIWLVGSHLGVDVFPKRGAAQPALRFRASVGTRVEKTEAIALRVLDIIKREAGPTTWRSPWVWSEFMLQITQSI